jgi:type VI secretion system secreted protein Hcp
MTQAQSTRTARTQTPSTTPTAVPTPKIVPAATAHGELAFLEFPDPSPGRQPIAITGEVTDPTHPRAIQVLAAALGIQNNVSAASGSSASPATFQKLRITKSIDTASSGLFLACASGASFPGANLYIRKTGTTTTDDVVYRFKLVAASGMQTTARSGDDAPQEIIDFDFGALQVEYLQPGSNSPITQAWSVVENEPVFDVTP